MPAKPKTASAPAAAMIVAAATFSMTLAQAEDFTGISKRSLYSAVQAGKLKAYRPGGKLLVRRIDLVAFVESVPYESKVDQVVDEVLSELAID